MNYQYFYIYAGCFVTVGTNEKVVFLHEKLSYQYRIKFIITSKAFPLPQRAPRAPKITLVQAYPVQIQCLFS